MKRMILLVPVLLLIALSGCKEKEDNDRALDRRAYNIERASGFRVFKINKDVDLRFTSGMGGGAMIGLSIPFGGKRARRLKKAEKVRTRFVKNKFKRVMTTKKPDTEKK